jgi:hypothetical protein
MTSHNFARRAVASFPLRREGHAPVVFRDDGATGCVAASTQGRGQFTAFSLQLTPSHGPPPETENVQQRLQDGPEGRADGR